MIEDNYGKNMLLFTSYWGEQTTFKMMPIKEKCPFTEVIYDPSTTLLVVISKIRKNNFQFVPKLDDHGDPVQAKKPKANGKPFKEQRVTMEVMQEYYIIEPEEQEDFINTFAVNSGDFPWKDNLRDMKTEPTIHKPEKSPLVDSQGRDLKEQVKKD